MAGPTTESLADDFKTLTSAVADSRAESAHFRGRMENVTEGLSSEIKTLSGTTERLSNEVKTLSSTTERLSNQVETLSGTTERIVSEVKTLSSTTERLSNQIETLSSTTERHSNDFDALRSTVADFRAESAHFRGRMENVTERHSSEIKTLTATTERIASNLEALTSVVAEFREEFAHFRGRVDSVLGFMKWLGSFVAVALLGCIGAIITLTWEAAKLDSRVDAHSDRMDRVEASIEQTMRILELRDAPTPTKGNSGTDLR